MELSEEALTAALHTMSDRSYRGVGMQDYVFDDRTRAALNRWGRLVHPDAKGWALALFYKPASSESSRGCCGYGDMSAIHDELGLSWEDEMVLMPVKWVSLTDPMTAGLRPEFAYGTGRSAAIYGAHKDPDLAQTVLRFPHVDIEPMVETSPLGGEETVSLTTFGSMYVWHLTPVTKDEAEMWANAYNAAEQASEMLPAMAYNFCCSEDPVQELTDQVVYEAWKSTYGHPVVCSGAHEDDVIFIGNDPEMPVCTCCAYWDLRGYVTEEVFPSMREYVNLVRDYLGPSTYDGRWNEASQWFRTGLNVAHDMCHLIASEGAEEWASWWEWYYWPELCSGQQNALPLAHQRFRSFASSA